jgi:hypothetical protein
MRHRLGIRVTRVGVLGGAIAVTLTGTVLSAWGISRTTTTVTVVGPQTGSATVAASVSGQQHANAGPSATGSSSPKPSSSSSTSASPSTGPSALMPTPTSASTLPGAPPTTPVYVAPGRPRNALMGVGAADPYDWGSWLGQKVQINEAWDDARSTKGVITWGAMDVFSGLRLTYSAGKWKGALSVAQPMFSDAETVQQCGTTAEISTWAKDLNKVWPSGPVFIRLGWEFNGDWYHWSMQPGDAGAFKACWIKWYGLVKAVSSRFDLVWNPNNQSSSKSLDVRDFWPGTAYVDAAGPDGYALSFGGVLMSTQRLGPNGEPVGIDAWQSWVASKGVPFAVPEWAIREQTWSSTSPVYIDQMRAAFVRAAQSATGLAYESYFDGGTKYKCRLSLHATGCADTHKAASDEYHKLWAVPYAH